MKILVTASGSGLDDQVDPRFGRAPWFLLIDPQDEGEEVEAIENRQNLNAAQGAGVQAAQTAADAGADWVLTGNVGPKAFRGLSAAGIKVAAGVGGTVREALEKFRRGEIDESGDANVEGHW